MRLKEMRKRAGLTARDVALEMGVSFQNVYNWENGSYLPPTKRLPEIARLYNCTVDELLGSVQVCTQMADGQKKIRPEGGRKEASINANNKKRSSANG